MRQTATAYTPFHRLADGLATALFAALSLWTLQRLAALPAAALHAWLVMAAAPLGWLAADLLSGLVHWTFDTWGSERTPVIGPRYVRPFREHHRDPSGMTQHGFLETNGASCTAALPALACAACMPLTSSGAVFVDAALLFTALGALLTNQCHKWAHMRRKDLAAAVRLAQRLRLILRAEQHLRHHARPFDSHYCTAAGWLNGPLHAIGLFRALERCITSLTGAPPRADEPRCRGLATRIIPRERPGC
jgi:plasmanylethanolamine desaturase